MTTPRTAQCEGRGRRPEGARVIEMVEGLDLQQLREMTGLELEMA